MVFRTSFSWCWNRPLLAAALIAATCPTTSQAEVFAIGNDGALKPIDGYADPQAQTRAAARFAQTVAVSAHFTMLTPVSAPPRFATATVRAANANGVSPDLLAALVWQESRWQRNAVSPAGAIGLAQIMPATAGGLRINPHDPVANLYGAAHYLREQIDRFGGNVELALAAYNAGPDRVRKVGGVPPIAETRAYVAAIMDRLSNISVRAD